ncbi:MAG: thioredoxin family protein [Patescibacteria group bacterium]
MKKHSIQVIGSGCQTCKQLFEDTKEIAKELNIDTEVEYITDVSKLVEMGVMTSPVLAINDRPVLTGGGKSRNDIKQVLKDVPSEETNTSDKCSCDGKC